MLLLVISDDDLEDATIDDAHHLVSVGPLLDEMPLQLDPGHIAWISVQRQHGSPAGSRTDVLGKRLLLRQHEDLIQFPCRGLFEGVSGGHHRMPIDFGQLIQAIEMMRITLSV